MNLEKFKELTFKKKIEWIIQYYGKTIVVAIIALFVLCSFLYSVFCPEPISDVCVLILSDDYLRDEVPFFEKEISDLTGGTTSVEVYNVSDVYGNSAFSIKLTSNQIDLVIAPKEETEQMMESGYLESYEILDGKDLCLGIPGIARKGEMLNKTIDYFKRGR